VKQGERFGMNRRGFLRAAGLTGAAGAMSPWLLPLLDTPAAAQAEGPPKRLLLFLTELGWDPFAFRMGPAGAPADVLERSAYHPAYRNEPDERRWEIDLTTIEGDRWSKALAPLAPMAHRALVLDGLGMLSIGAEQYGDGHARGWNHAITGHPASAEITNARAMGGAPSIDQRLARFLRSQDPTLTDLTALLVRVSRNWGGDGTNGFHYWFHDRDESGEFVRIPRVGDPRVLHERLFAGMGGGDAGDEDRFADKRAVLSALEDRFATRFPNLSRRDRDRIEQHRQRLSDIQTRLDRLAAFTCEAPGLPERPRDDTGEVYLANLDLFFELTTAALACDLSRVVAFEMKNGRGVERDLYGASDKDFHQWYSHGTNPTRNWYGLENARVSQADYDQWRDAAPILGNKNRFHVEQVTRFAQRLDEIPEGDGTVLDNTLIMMVDEISTGSHGHDQWPVVLLGNLGGAFRTGRYIRFPRTNYNPGINGMGRYVGQPHNKLLISICQAMGMEDLDDLGITSVQGRRSGDTISLRGPLDELA